MQYVISIISVGSVYALISVGFALVYGVLQLSNFSHGAVMASGAFIAYTLVRSGVNWVLALLVTAVLCAALSSIIEFLALRRIRNNEGDSIYMFVSSVTVLMVINSILDIIFGSSVRAFPKIFDVAIVELFGYNFPKINIMIISVCAFLLIILSWFLIRTKAGISIRAAAADQTVCRLMGINTNLTISFVFALSGALAGIGGVFLGISYSVCPTMSSLISKAFMATVIGGLGSLLGAVIGAYILAALEVLTQLYAGWAWVSIACFTLTVLFLLLKPSGILGEKIDTKV